MPNERSARARGEGKIHPREARVQAVERRNEGDGELKADLLIGTEAEVVLAVLFHEVVEKADEEIPPAHREGGKEAAVPAEEDERRTRRGRA